MQREAENVYIYGLWLEGAIWESEKNRLVETTTQDLFIMFPIVKIETVKCADT